MSLSALKRKVAAPKNHIRKEIRLLLPPEYDLSLEQWVEYIRSYNRTDRPVKLATMFQQFISNREPGHIEFNTLITASEITQKDHYFYVDLFFDSSRAGLTALLLFEAEPVSIAPICNLKNNTGITHLVMVYTPT